MTLVVDASIALKWFLVEPDSAIAQDLFRRPETLIAPDLITAEFSNVIWLRRRQGALAEREGATQVTADKQFVDRVRAAGPKARVALLGESLP